tara:strand:- start:6 stop:236 length:231 start_codon:yes stop_codon:yes gene_type:complete
MKERWIRNKAIQLRNQPIRKEREYFHGEDFPLFGKNFKLKVLEGGRVGTKLDVDYLLIYARAKEIKDVRKLRIKTY